MATYGQIWPEMSGYGTIYGSIYGSIWKPVPFLALPQKGCKKCEKNEKIAKFAAALAGRLGWPPPAVARGRVQVKAR